MDASDKPEPDAPDGDGRDRGDRGARRDRDGDAGEADDAVDPWESDSDGGGDAVDPWDTDDADAWDAGTASDRTERDGPADGGPPGTDAEREDAERDEADGSRNAGPAGSGPRRYRILDRTDDELVFVDLDTPDPGPGPGPDEPFEPVRVAAASDDADAADALAELAPGAVVRADLRWADSEPLDSEPPNGDPAVGDPTENEGETGGAGTGDDGTPLARPASLTVERGTRLWYGDGVTDLFEAARDAWQDVRATGDAMGSRVTRDTDGEPNGALYVFAEAGARDLLGEFRSGTTPLEPLLERVNEDLDDAGPREVFVLRPERGEFVVVYIAFERDGLLARTVRDTYDLDA